MYSNLPVVRKIQWEVEVVLPSRASDSGTFLPATEYDCCPHIFKQTERGKYFLALNFWRSPTVSWHFHILPVYSITFFIGSVVSSSNDPLVCVKYMLRGSEEETQWFYFFRNFPFLLQPIIEGSENAVLEKTASSLSFQKYQRNVQKWKKN